MPGAGVRGAREGGVADERDLERRGDPAAVQLAQKLGILADPRETTLSERRADLERYLREWGYDPRQQYGFLRLRRREVDAAIKDAASSVKSDERRRLRRYEEERDELDDRIAAMEQQLEARGLRRVALREALDHLRRAQAEIETVASRRRAISLSRTTRQLDLEEQRLDPRADEELKRLRVEEHEALRQELEGRMNFHRLQLQLKDALGSVPAHEVAESTEEARLLADHQRLPREKIESMFAAARDGIGMVEQRLANLQALGAAQG